MTEVWLDWRSDFTLAANGDLATADGDDEGRQRLERRLFTPQQGYVWHPEYGAGLPQRIGSPYTINQIKSVVASQIGMEQAVAPSPPPTLTVDVSPNQPDLVAIGIKYFDAVSGVAVSFTITL
jgi:hypothetical protein